MHIWDSILMNQSLYYYEMSSFILIYLSFDYFLHDISLSFAFTLYVTVISYKP